MNPAAAAWHKRALPLSILCASAFAVIAVLAKTKQLAGFDAAVMRIVQSRENSSMTAIMKFFSAIGTGYPVILLGAAVLLILYIVFGQRRELLLFLAVTLLSSLLNHLLKVLLHMERPDIHRLVEQTGYGFPSGHAMGALSLYGITGFLLWKHIPNRTGRTLVILGAAFFILAIGMSRIYLGVHFPSDVIGGYLAGAAWLFFCLWVYRRFTVSRQQAPEAHN